jgi:hypothetical protein
LLAQDVVVAQKRAHKYGKYGGDRLLGPYAFFEDRGECSKGAYHGEQLVSDEL